jgi:hypothetical protein
MSLLTKSIIKVFALKQNDILTYLTQFVTNPITQVIFFSTLIGLILILIFKKHL